VKLTADTLGALQRSAQAKAGNTRKATDQGSSPEPTDWGGSGPWAEPTGPATVRVISSEMRS